MFGFKKKKVKNVAEEKDSVKQTLQQDSDLKSSEISNDCLKKSVLSYSIKPFSDIIKLILESFDSNNMNPMIKCEAIVKTSPLDYLNKYLQQNKDVSNGFVPVYFSDGHESSSEEDVEVDIL